MRKTISLLAAIALAAKSLFTPAFGAEAISPMPENFAPQRIKACLTKLEKDPDLVFLSRPNLERVQDERSGMLPGLQRTCLRYSLRTLDDDASSTEELSVYHEPGNTDFHINDITFAAARASLRWGKDGKTVFHNEGKRRVIYGVTADSAFLNIFNPTRTGTPGKHRSLQIHHFGQHRIESIIQHR